MPPPASADRPAVRPQSAKQRSAATTVMATWPSTTLLASRLAWGNSRVTTTLLLQVDNPRTQQGPTRAAGGDQLCPKIVWLGNDLRVPWPGARIIYADPGGLNTKTPIFPGCFYVSGTRGESLPRIPVARLRKGPNDDRTTGAGPPSRTTRRRRRHRQRDRVLRLRDLRVLRRADRPHLLSVGYASQQPARIAGHLRRRIPHASTGRVRDRPLCRPRRPEARDAAVLLAHGHRRDRVAARARLRIDRHRRASARDRIPAA